MLRFKYKYERLGVCMITLDSITWDNWRACIKLELGEGQDKFVASNLYSLAQSYVSLLNEKQPPMTYAISMEGEVIGFIMMYYESKEESDHGVDSYGICRLMIDKKHQGKGYGKAAFLKALEYLKTYPQGPAAYIYISYVPENEVARKMYLNLGFEETGEVVDGELIARLAL